MSLDLYLHSSRPVRHRSTGVFIRENGMTRELGTIDEVRAHFPDATNLDDIRIQEYEDQTYFHTNLTHNLTEMASQIPIAGTDGVCALPRHPGDPTDKPLTAYELLWHPELNPLLTPHVQHHRDEDDGREWDEQLTRLTPEYVRQAMAAYQYAAAHRDRLTPYNPSNGWGSYDQLLSALQQLVQCLVGIPFDEYDLYLIESNV